MEVRKESINIIRFVFIALVISVDKFERQTQRSLRESIPYRLSDDGNIDVEKKIIRNLGKPTASKHAVTLSHMQKHCLLVEQDDDDVDVGGRKLSIVEYPVNGKDAVSNLDLYEKCLQYGDFIDARNDYITNVADPKQKTDAVNKGYVDKKTIQKAQGAWWFNNLPLSRVGPPLFASDEVYVKYMHKNTVSLKNDVFTALGKRSLT